MLATRTTEEYTAQRREGVGGQPELLLHPPSRSSSDMQRHSASQSHTHRLVATPVAPAAIAVTLPAGVYWQWRWRGRPYA